MATVLVIDDDNGVRRMIRTILERAGYAVLEAHDGAEGMGKFQTNAVDLVITDLFMPGQDGIETIQLLREESPSARILAISGGGRVGAAGPLRDAELFGADAVLAKPFGREQLVTAVRDLLG